MVVIDHRDIGKSKLELLTDLLYESNGDRIPLSKVRYGFPVEADTRPDIKTDHNTFIPLKVDQDYSTLYEKGKSGLLYRRIEIADHLESVQDVVFEFHSATFPVRLCDILPQINAQLEYPLDCGDVVSYSIEGPGEQTVVIKMNPRSYLWTGRSTIKVNVINDNLIPLYNVSAIRGFDVYGTGGPEGEYTGLPN